MTQQERLRALVATWRERKRTGDYSIVDGEADLTRCADELDAVRSDVLESFVELLAICKEALPLVEDYLQGIPEFADKMRAAIERAERVSRL